MMRLRRASAIAALCVLASAATAYLECAWVLWEQVNTQSWSSKEGFSDAESCKRALRSSIGQVVSRYPGSEDTGGNTAIIATNSGRLALTFACLPDTVDPRGAEGRSLR